jgi:hypothetical protein
MSQTAKLSKTVDRLMAQLERDDFPAAYTTLKQTNFRPTKAMVKFVRKAPVTFSVRLLHLFKAYCMDGLTREIIFNRAGNFCLLLSLHEIISIPGYYREKQCLLAVIENFGVVVPLLLVQKMREIEHNIKHSSSNEKLLAQGFTRAYCDAQFSKYIHPDLDFVFIVRTFPEEAKKLKIKFTKSCTRGIRLSYRRPMKVGFRSASE